jgi:hypothetical protein
MKPLFLILLALPLCGCDLNALTGEPSEFQKYQQRISALETQVASLSAPVVASAAPVKADPVHQPIPEPAPEPECVPVFRVKTCP